jgi:cytochrome b
MGLIYINTQMRRSTHPSFQAEDALMIVDREPVGKNETVVWDLFVRVFHWTLVVGFFIAYLSGDDLQSLHVIAGYCVGALVLARLVWGVAGSHHARFASFVYRPGKVWRYARDLLAFRGRRYLGHSPAGGAMVLLLLAMLTLLVTSGLVALALREGAGPLAGWIAPDRALGGVVGEIHEFLANVTLGLVLLHLCGVLLASLVHGENLVKAMWTGRKPTHLELK